MKRGPAMATRDFAQMADSVSKAALIDALWCACQLGTDDTPEQYTINAAHNIAIALTHRGDRLPKTVAQWDARHEELG